MELGRPSMKTINSAMKAFKQPSLLFIILACFSCDIIKEQEVAVSSVFLGQQIAEMIIGETAQLYATVLPSNATDKTVLWTSSKLSVATITSSGLLTAIAEGTSTVTASSGGQSATCLVTVSKGFVAVTSVSINKTELVLSKGQSEILKAIVRPDDATDKTVTWDITNTAIATVDSNGKVIAMSGGDATITAKVGDQVATCALTVTVPVESVSLDTESITLEENSSTTLMATVSPDDATDKSVTWSSSNTAIATVDQSGKVTAAKEGYASITAKAGDKQATCSVTVKKKIIAVASVTLNKTALSLNKGQSETLIATVSPDDATDKSVTWSSSNTAIATVDSNGKATAVAGGNATITARVGDQQASCSVVVTVPVASVTLDRESVTMEEESSTTLAATVKPDDATDKSVTWSSSNSKVCTVDETGMVIAVKEGTAIISANVGDKKAICSVTVRKKTIAVTSITLNKTDLSLEKGQSETLIASVKPENASDKTVAWSTSDSRIAAVDSYGKVTALSSGSVIIKAKAGDIEAFCNITIIVPVTSVAIDQNSITLEEGQTATLTATVLPEDATDKTITWSSSNDSIATVDETGKVMAIKEGEVSILSKAGEKTASCKVTVKVNASAQAISFADMNLKAKLVAAFDTNGDGELSYREAAAVTSGNELKAAFNGFTAGSSFGEFQYFTGVTDIPSRLFNKWNISSIILPNSIQSIGSSAFEDCFNLLSIDIPESVTVIYGSAFKNCTLLTKIVIPEGVSSIYGSTFWGCKNLESISIPESVQTISDNAFHTCPKLKNVYITNLDKWLRIKKTVYQNPFFDSHEGHLFLNNTEVTTVDIPEGIDTDWVLYGCSGISSVTLPEGITRIGEDAFQWCSGLVSFDIPKTVNLIDNGAFLGCTNLSSIILPEGLQFIGEQAFFRCSSLLSINIPTSLSSIGKQAFSGTECLSKLYINDLNKWLDLDKTESRHPFTGSSNGHLFINGEEVTKIDMPLVSNLAYAFYRCTFITSITIPEGIRIIGESAFQYCNFETIVLPESIETIDTNAFYWCKRLKTIVIPSNVKSIQKWAFYACDSLNSIYLKSVDPPVLGKEPFRGTYCPIYVPAQSVEAYKTSEYWSDYADRIRAIQ